MWTRSSVTTGVCLCVRARALLRSDVYVGITLLRLLKCQCFRASKKVWLKLDCSSQRKLMSNKIILKHKLKNKFKKLDAPSSCKCVCARARLNAFMYWIWMYWICRSWWVGRLLIKRMMAVVMVIRVFLTETLHRVWSAACTKSVS